MNTKIYYLYRDADNYKVHNECVVSGTLSEKQIEEIISCLLDGEYFIPRFVGLPEKKFETYNPQVDHPFFELGESSFVATSAPPTVEQTAQELVEAFKRRRGLWQTIEADRALELLNLIIGDKVKAQDGNRRNVLEWLSHLGFTKSELLALQFSDAEVGFCEEDKDNV